MGTLKDGFGKINDGLLNCRKRTDLLVFPDSALTCDLTSLQIISQINIESGMHEKHVTALVCHHKEKL